MRKSGILLPVFSLPDPHGQGRFSKYAYDFIDRLAAAGQSYWQILPLTIAGKGNSPYSPLSCFAGEPKYIDPECLAAKGLISADDLAFADTEAMLRAAFASFDTDAEGFRDYCSENAGWLDNFALYEGLRHRYDKAPWIEWPEEIRFREPSAMAAAAEELSGEMTFRKWIQYEFDCEWQALREYAHSKGVDIIGDIPIYASYESADCWASPGLFKLNADLRPETVSGCPPDDFNSEGQIWENPIYDWNAIAASGYEWWVARIKRMFRLYDVVRLDHARGFESFFQIPVSTMRAADGWWEKGPGLGFFNAIENALGRCRFIAEDLGYMTPEVAEMIRQTGIPNMKVVQFGFESDMSNPHLPENATENSIIYTGTHDNDTTVGWYHNMIWWMREKVDRYVSEKLGKPEHTPQEVAGLMIKLAMESRSACCVIPMQDYLLLGSEARVNVPGTSEGNWKWQMDSGAFTDELAAEIRALTETSNRI